MHLYDEPVGMRSVMIPGAERLILVGGRLDGRNVGPEHGLIVEYHIHQVVNGPGKAIFDLVCGGVAAEIAKAEALGRLQTELPDLEAIQRAGLC